MADTPKKNLFVDANVFLGFYHFSNDDLDELQKLIELIENGEIALYATTQVIDEVNRNRDTKIQDAYKRFKEIDFSASFPQMCKGYPEYEATRKALAVAKRNSIALDKKLSADIASRSLKADEVIAELIALATIIDTSGVTDRAHKRYLAGNPPGKNDSYGDAITWEGLLETVPQGEDLFFLSDDKDFKSPLGNEQFNSFLLNEWNTTKASNICYYPRLSAFFNEHHKEIALRQEAERRELISALGESGTFATTHSVIRQLSRLDDITDSEALELVSAANSNGQVYSILTDSDVKNFFTKLLKEKGAAITAELRDELIEGLVEDGETEAEITAESA